MIAINMNDYVLIKLRPAGVEILRRDEERIRADVPSYHATQFTEGPDGYTKMQLWAVMEMFGPHIHMGFDVPFETDIRIVRPEIAA